MVGLLAACSEQAPPPPAPQPAASLNCLTVPDVLLRDIEDGLTVEGATLRDGAGHVAINLERSFFVAAEVDGPELEGDGDVGVWLVTGLVVLGEQTIQSVPGVATLLSSFDDSSLGSVRVKSDAGGISEARECLEISLQV
jgi:hypothetical protein